MSSLRIAPVPPRGRRLAIGLFVALLALVWLQAEVRAQSSSASFALQRLTIDGGSGRMDSTSFSLQGTLGQPDAGEPMTSVSYTLRGGFHRAAAVSGVPDALFADGFETR